jgi:hypothetical protein
MKYALIQTNRDIGPFSAIVEGGTVNHATYYHQDRWTKIGEYDTIEAALEARNPLIPTHYYIVIQVFN